jgi:hypothetical protein
LVLKQAALSTEIGSNKKETRGQKVVDFGRLM